LAASRAIGETMIVVMAASTASNLSANPFDSMTTVTVQIVAMLTGEASTEHHTTLSAFALGFVLFLVTLALNFVALRVVRRFREAYE
jgi:phosphate transport system permease protein